MYLIARADPGLLRLQGIRKRADLKNKEVECFKDLPAINNSISQTMTRLTMWQGTWNGTAEIRMQRIALLTSWDSMDYSFPAEKSPNDHDTENHTSKISLEGWKMSKLFECSLWVDSGNRGENNKKAKICWQWEGELVWQFKRELGGGDKK